jgi:WXG100 family type VII secretion target
MSDIGNSSILVREDLEGAGAWINARAQQIADELAALKAQLAPLAETWDGSANQYYEGLQQEWNLAAEGLFGPDGILGRIAQTMNVNWSNYSEAEWSRPGRTPAPALPHSPDRGHRTFTRTRTCTRTCIRTPGRRRGRADGRDVSHYRHRAAAARRSGGSGPRADCAVCRGIGAAVRRG